MPPKGLISFRAPLAQAVLSGKVGEIVEAGESRLGEIMIVKIEG